MNINSIEENCTGCGGCMIVCPLNCIEMKEDVEGFMFPEVDNDKCIKCGKCWSFCNQTKKGENDILHSYAVKSLCKDDLKKSSSGGIFPLLAREWIAQGGYVCAATLNKDYEVKHIVFNDESGIKKCQGSKYVQSHIYSAMDEMRKLLAIGKRVMFVGTPCQVACVKKLFHKYRENVFFVDLICHGVPSSGKFNEYIKREYVNKGLLDEKFGFRHKNEFQTSIFGFKLKNNKIVYAEDDLYYGAYVKRISLRESCYHCKYVGTKREGDITIGDCATIDKYIKISRGSQISTMLINTSSGQVIWNKIKGKTFYCNLDLDEEKFNNSPLYKNMERPKIRDEFYLDFDNLSNSRMKDKYLEKKTLSKRIKQFIKRGVPVYIKQIIKEVFRYGNTKQNNG